MKIYKLSQIEEVEEKELDIDDIKEKFLYLDKLQEKIEYLEKNNIDYEIVNANFQNLITLLVFEFDNDKYVVEETDNDIEKADEWIYKINNFYLYIDIVDFNDIFWENPEIVYHGTKKENIENIKEEGLTTQNITRGISNRDTGFSVFTTKDIDEANYYYEVVIEIDTVAMKGDGYMPDVSQEEPIEEAKMSEQLAQKVGLENFYQDVEAAMSENTVIFYDDIPPKYLKIV